MGAFLSSDICAADIRGVYSTEGHPQIESGEKTQEEVLQEFINNFQRDGDDKVTYDEFLGESPAPPSPRQVLGSSLSRESFIHSTLTDSFTPSHAHITEYYGDLSFSIDNEEYWTLMMTNAWKL